MVQLYHDPDRFRRLAFRALERGATMEQSRFWTRPGVRWDISGNCEKPVYRELSASTPAWHAKRGGAFIEARERSIVGRLNIPSGAGSARLVAALAGSSGAYV